MISATKGFRITAAAGFTVILLAIILSFFYPANVDNTPQGFSAPIIALEFSTSLSDASQLFADDTRLINRFHTGHQLDMLFLVSYGAFLAFANLSSWYTQRRAISLIGIIAAGIAASADVAENLQLMQLTGALLGTGSAPDFWLLRLFTSTKFLMICASMLCLIPLLWERGLLGRLYTACTLLLTPATLLTLTGYYEFSSAMALLTVIAWVCILIWVLKVRNGVDSIPSTDKSIRPT